ncbi:hypothetical protein NGRA_3328 [Nosema granulosis]|uniref:ISXO2-like transposase domain-containing protein n=1 Tax=Nosema granulosis TaxID=83296 RepID=A0A9P6KXA1_9MICR|nr:hypothetical protein NGRA_3328 [Nosema granulosis]
MIFEIDESKFRKRKYHKGHHVEGVWILGMIERENTKKIKLIRVSNRSKDELNQLIKKSVKKDTVIYTDCWKGYSGLNDYFSDHKTVNHSKHFKDPITQVHTNTIEGSWAAIKAQTPIRGRTEKTICRGTHTETNISMISY